MKKELSVNQVIVILCLSLISLKVIILPSLLAEVSQQDLWITASVIFLTEIVTLYFLIQMGKKYPDKTFFEIIQSAFGKPISIVCAIVVLIYYFFKTLLAIYDTQTFINVTLYHSEDWLIFIIPLVLLMVYVASKSFMTIGRVAEIMVYIVFFGGIVSFLISLFEVDFTNIMPVLSQGINPIFNGVMKCNFWFGDYFIFILMMGRIKNDKKMTLRIVLWYAITCIFLVLFLICFYCLFERASTLHKIAVSDLGHFVPQFNQFRLDWIADIVWGTSEIFQCTIGMFLIKTCFNVIFPTKNNAKYIDKSSVFLVILGGLFIYLAKISSISMNSLINFIQTYCGILTGIMNILPTLLFIAILILKKKNKKKNYYGLCPKYTFSKNKGYLM